MSVSRTFNVWGGGLKSTLISSDILIHNEPVVVGKTLAGYKRGRPLPVLPRMGRPLPVLTRIRPRLPRGTLRVTHDGMPRQTLTSTRAVRVTSDDMPSQ